MNSQISPPHGRTPEKQYWFENAVRRNESEKKSKSGPEREASGEGTGEAYLDSSLKSVFLS